MGNILCRTLSRYALATLLTSAVAYGHASSENNVYAAAETGNLEAVKAFLSVTKDINAKDQRGRTLLIAAASSGQLQVMELLMQNGADLNLQDSTGATALHVATSGGYAQAVRLLLGRGADTTLRTQSGLTALEIAQTSQNAEIITEFQSRLGQASGYQSSVDQAQTWRNAASRAIVDPCRVTANIARDNLKQGADTLVRLGQAERRAWAMRSQAQRARLCSMVEQQVKQEFRFIEDVARSESATRVAADANSMQALWAQRLQVVTERIRELRRQEMAQAAGRPTPLSRPGPSPRPAGPTPQPQGPGPQGQTRDANTVADYFAPSSTRADQDQLATAWAGSGTETNTDQVLTDFNDLIFKDLGYLRTTAVATKASAKVLTAIDAVIFIRSQRDSLVRSDVQGMAAANSAAAPGAGAGQMSGQQAARRGTGVQNGQGQGAGYNRGMRRGRT